MGMLILNGLAHAVIALAMQIVVGLLTGNWWAGAALGVGFYWGREKRDHEIKSKDLRWWRGWTPFEWDLDGQSDFWWPFATCITLAVLVGVVWPLSS